MQCETRRFRRDKLCSSSCQRQVSLTKMQPTKAYYLDTNQQIQINIATNHTSNYRCHQNWLISRKDINTSSERRLTKAVFHWKTKAARIIRKQWKRARTACGGYKNSRIVKTRSSFTSGLTRRGTAALTFAYDLSGGSKITNPERRFLAREPPLRGRRFVSPDRSPRGDRAEGAAKLRRRGFSTARASASGWL